MFNTEDGKVEVEVEQGTNLLQAALNAGIDLDFFCSSGQCGTCQVKAGKGAENLSPLTDQELDVLSQARRRTGHRLACQVRVFGDVEIS